MKLPWRTGTRVCSVTKCRPEHGRGGWDERLIPPVIPQRPIFVGYLWVKSKHPSACERSGWWFRASSHSRNGSRRGLAGAIQACLVIRRCRQRQPASSSLLASIRAATANAQLIRQRLIVADKTPHSGKSAAYPPFPLAQNLAMIAQLIRADLGIRIYFAEMGGGGIGGFDTHANQAANHGALLRELSESTLAFVNDLNRDRLLDSVLVMTFSEFGRTLSENGRRGTDHGAAAPIFMIGGKVKGGLWGAHPSLSDLEADSPKFHTDFRRVYATVLGGGST